jgi:hypothetical protein
MTVVPLARPVTMRAGSGLGDSLYLQSAARHLAGKGHRVEVHSNWPDVFRPLADKVTVLPFSRVEVGRIVHYTAGKNNRRTTQWQDCCARAGIGLDTELRLDWKPVDPALIRKVRATGAKPVIALLLPRLPMDRKDNFGAELLPNCAVIQRVIDRIGARARFVQVGKGDALHHFSGIDLDLKNATSVSGMIDAVYAADAVLGYVSFFVPLAESLGKPGLMVWSRRGVKSDTDYIRTITPQKIIHRPDLLKAVFDDAPDDELQKAADAFFEQVGSQRVLYG